MSGLSEDEVKIFLQRHLQRGTVVIIGSGLSCAEGLPGMGELSNHLATADPASRSVSVSAGDWKTITDAIQIKGIETALHELSVSESVADFIRYETASFIISRETKAVQEVFGGTRTLKLSRLLPHLPQDGRVQIITTNYDRLIELAAEMSGFKVDTKAFGLYYATFSPNAGPYAFCDNVEWVNKSPRRIERKIISLYKPHGSVDWIAGLNGTAVRSGFPIATERSLIITPGQNKYRAGYDQPFDMQRELANRAIDAAQRFLVVGYGFNDDHLETHLNAKIKSGAPTVIMTRGLTANARAILPAHANLMALEADPSDPASTLVYFRGETLKLSGQQIWDVEGFSSGVLGA